MMWNEKDYNNYIDFIGTSEFYLPAYWMEDMPEAIKHVTNYIEKKFSKSATNFALNKIKKGMRYE